jgi:hypothetical protein
MKLASILIKPDARLKAKIRRLYNRRCAPANNDRSPAPEQAHQAESGLNHIKELEFKVHNA